jgi:putative endonuclease
MYYTYVLKSKKDNLLYIGYSEDLRKRIETHQKGKATATKYRRPIDLIYYEAYLNKIDAKKREIFLKSGSGHKFLKKQLENYFKTQSAHADK